MDEKLLNGEYHDLDDFISKYILSDEAIVYKWNKITPRQRDEWICFITSAKKHETKEKRALKMLNFLKSGRNESCC
ncbi:MAG: YdeI/OmpD-associated family protein [Candidatus Dojkabacteria bacterium]|nr:YdeI/OmpD-associated family protein [Candidatus Dojkabacteria bacterium]